MNAIVYVVAGLAVWLFAGTPKLPHLFEKAPPVAQAQDAQKALDEAKAAQAKAEAALKAKQDEEEAAKSVALGIAHQDVAGIPMALSGEPQTPGVVLAIRLASDANSALDAAIGKLPTAQQAEIKAIVDGMRSADKARADAAEAKLKESEALIAAKDTELTQVRAEIPSLKVALAAKDTVVAQKQGDVDKANAAVQTWAEKKKASDDEASSAKAWEAWLGRILIAVAFLYFLGHYFLPLLAQSYPQIGWLKTAANLAKNATTAHE